MILKTVYLAFCTTGLLWVNTAMADVPPPPALETPKATAVAPAVVTPPANPKLIGTPPPADPYPPLVPEMVSIPAGTFTMGCVNGRDDLVGDCGIDESPAHEVSVKAFQIGRYEVTFAEWDRCEAAGVCLHANDSGWGRGNRPVINVSWDDVQTYIGWLNSKTGKHYRLPTEAEWEYAARAGGEAAYSWGYKAGHEFANYGKEECCSGLVSGKDQWENTAPVGSFAANPYGLYDMHGNVWEWCQDKWHGDYQGAPTDGSAWESGDSAIRVLRGGSWHSNAQYLRSATRDISTPVSRNNNVGFRLVLGQA